MRLNILQEFNFCGKIKEKCGLNYYDKDVNQIF